MKKIIYLFIFLSSIILWHACKQEEENLPGTIYGVVTDKATGEPVKSAGVELSPVGLKTITGTEGQFEFTELVPGNYTLLVTKTGYMDYASNTIEVKPGQTAQSDIQMELLPPALKVVDDNRKEISELDFGEAESDVARSFNLFNDGEETLNFQITKTAVWIDSISKTEGSVSAGNIQPIVVFIDRDKLHERENATTIHITSNSGSKQIKVIATNNRTEMSLNILETTDITASSAVFNAEIINSGNPKYTERGFVYHTSPMPTKEQTIALLTAPVTEETKFSVKADGLELDQTYYVRAYATNMLGTVYSSNQISFIANATLPTVSTQQVTQIDIASGTATFNGTIVTEGDPVYSERGFVYGTVPNPTIDGNKKIVSGRGTGAYSANITELAEGYTYYVRAYATNEQGTAYGVDVSFSFIATMPTVVTSPVSNIKIGNGTVTFNGKVETLGDLGYTERGFVYNTTHNPTIDDTKLVASGSGLGAYSLNASGIQEGAIYYVRAYLQNSKGVVYGEEVAFDFNAIMPTLSTKEVTNKNIANGMATFNGIIETVGDPMYTERGFVYGIMHNPTLTDGSKLVVPGLGTGLYMANVTGLSEGNLYYIRAYANTPKSCVYGEEVALNFTATMPKVFTSAVTNINIGAGTATFNAKVDSLGDLGYTERGFVYNTAHNPTIDDTKLVASGSGLGIYSLNVSDIQEGDVYYVRAYLQNSKGVVYGEEVVLNFMATMPKVSTSAVTNINIGAGTATFNAKVDSLGDWGYTERGFVYSTTHNPTIDDTKLVASGSGLGTYSLNASGIQEGAIYYVRAYLQNSKGVVYGEEVSFDFNGVMPVVKTQAVTNKIIASGVATLNGTIVSKGDPSYTERGFVYGITPNPTKDDATIKIVSGTGTGSYSISVSNLNMGSVYHVRAYAESVKGIVYGENVSFDFNAVMPIVSTDRIEIPNNTSAVFYGTVSSLGDPAYIERGFVYGTMLLPSLENAATKIVAEGTILGVFNAEVSDLDPQETYNIRAYVKSQAGVVYGEIKTIDPEFREYWSLPTFVHAGQVYRVYPDLGSTMNWDQANQACEDLTFAGYDDWILPSKEILNTMYINKDEIGGFTTTTSSSSRYWSSTYEGSSYDYSYSYYYVQFFSTGNQSYDSERNGNRVRPVRLEQ